MKIAGFYEESMANGTGWRAVLFVSGCKHRCPGCHNRKAQDFRYGDPINYKEILKVIRNNPILRGLTLSGGEPMLFPVELLPLVHAVKSMGLDIWCYTGYTLEELLKNGTHAQRELLKNIDILVDGRFIEELKDPSLRFRGSANQRIIDMNHYWKTGAIEGEA